MFNNRILLVFWFESENRGKNQGKIGWGGLMIQNEFFLKKNKPPYPIMEIKKAIS